MNSSRTPTANRLLLQALTDPEYVAVGVPDMHLANLPRHVLGGPGHLHPLLQTVLVDGVDIVDPNRHPDPVVAFLVPVGTERERRRAASPAPLRVLAKEDLAVPRADAAEPGWISPLPALGPSELLEPLEAGTNVGNVEYWCQSLGEHLHLHAAPMRTLPFNPAIGRLVRSIVYTSISPMFQHTHAPSQETVLRSTH